MGEWYDYKVRFLNQNTNIIDKLINDRYAYFDENNLILLIKKIDDTNKELYPDYKLLCNHYKDRNDIPYEELAIGKENDNTIFYVSKWSPYLGIVKALSYLYPDEIIETKEDAPYYDRDNISYIKNGQWCNKIGEKIQTALYGVNISLVKRITDTAYELNLPIGEENDKWGKIIFNAKDISMYRYRYNITFPKNEYTVKFKNSEIILSPKEIVTKYFESINNYHSYMNEQMVLIDVPENYLYQMRNTQSDETYYIVSVPCPSNVSENNILKTTVPDFNVKRNDNGTIDVTLTKRKNPKNCKVVKNREMMTAPISAEDIKKYYDADRSREHILEEISNEEEMER